MFHLRGDFPSKEQSWKCIFLSELEMCFLCNCFPERPLGLCQFLGVWNENGCRAIHQPLWACQGLGSSQFPMNISSKSIRFLNCSSLPYLELRLVCEGLSLTLFLLAQKVFECSRLMVRVLNALPSRARSQLRFGTNHMSGQIRFSATVLGQAGTGQFSPAAGSGQCLGRVPHHGEQQFTPIQGPSFSELLQYVWFPAQWP